MQQCDPSMAYSADSSQRGSALLLALMVSIVLAFLGIGLLLQTSLGLEASGADRWVVKSLYAADAGVQMEIHMLRNNQMETTDTSGNPLTFELEEDASVAGLLRGEYQVTLGTICEILPSTRVLGWSEDFRRRYFHMRSHAERRIGTRVQSQATVAADLSIGPVSVHPANFVPMQTVCQ